MLVPFQHIDFVDVSRMAASLTLRYATHFNDDVRRQKHPNSPHHDTRTIRLRGPVGDPVKNWFLDVEHADDPLLEIWPSAREVVNAVAASLTRVTGQEILFGKIVVVSLMVGGWVDWHRDDGEYALAHDRYHVCLQASPGARTLVGTDAFMPQVGFLTFVNNKMPHGAINTGPCERIIMILDARKPRLAS